MNIDLCFPREFVGASDLKGEPRTKTIREVRYDELFCPGQSKKKKKAIVHFVDSDKKLVLNRTNANSLVKFLGSKETNDWIGAQVTLYPTTCDAFGKTVDCIRVKSAKRATATSRKTATTSNRITPVRQQELQRRAVERGINEDRLTQILATFGRETIGELLETEYEQVIAEIE